MDRIIITVILLGSLVLSGCAAPQPYNNISFCWTSDHRLKPQERFLQVNASNEDVINQLKEWVADNNGEIIEQDNERGKIVAINSESSEKYQKANNIATQRWESYDENKFQKWRKKDIQAFKKLVEGQVEWKEAMNTESCRLIIKVEKREKTIHFKKQVGTRTENVYTPPRVIVLPHKKVSVPGGVTSKTVPVYEDATKTIKFHSILEFHILQNGKNTTIYASGYPVEADTNTKADYGKTIGHYLWPMVTGQHETQNIKKAFAYIQERNKNPLAD